MFRNSQLNRGYLVIGILFALVSTWSGYAIADTDVYAVPTELNFGAVPIGADNVLHFIVYNQTAKAIDVRLKTARPFEVDRSKLTCHLEPKGAIAIAVRFHSDETLPQNGIVSIGIDGVEVTCRANQPGWNRPTRSKLLQPFSSASIWNTPLGNHAVYKPAGFKSTTWMDKDDDYFLYDGRSQPLYAAEHWWPDICDGQKYLRDVWLTDTLTTDPKHPGNNSTAWLLDDGKTLYQANPMSRCQAGGPVYCGWPTTPDTVSIYGTGITGGHGGSGLSSIGGTIRLGELVGDQPIRHVLKINVQAEHYCSELNGGFRWPAWRADAYAMESDTTNPNYPHRYNVHGVAMPGVGMGALVALPPSVDINSLGLVTESAKKLAWTLQNYGAYIADDTYYPTVALALEKGAVEEFDRYFRFPFTCKSGPWHDDMMKLYELLNVVDNNGPNNIGGGGTPRQPQAPPIGD